MVRTYTTLAKEYDTSLILFGGEHISKRAEGEIALGFP